MTVLPPEHLKNVKMECFHCVPSSWTREHLQRHMRDVELPQPCMYMFAVIKTSQAGYVQHLQTFIWPRVRSRSYRGHRASYLSHKLRQGFPSLCKHQHTHTPLPCNVSQEDEFHPDRGSWRGLALLRLCVCDCAHCLQSDVVKSLLHSLHSVLLSLVYTHQKSFPCFSSLQGK